MWRQAPARLGELQQNCAECCSGPQIGVFTERDWRGKVFALAKANVKIAAIIESNDLKQYAQKCFSLRRRRLP
jgi:hypothetical protein